MVKAGLFLTLAVEVVVFVSAASASAGAVVIVVVMVATVVVSGRVGNLDDSILARLALRLFETVIEAASETILLTSARLVSVLSPLSMSNDFCRTNLGLLRL
jgi:hypothetical protein